MDRLEFGNGSSIEFTPSTDPFTSATQVAPDASARPVVAVYADGGVIGRNPSPDGVSWAWCHVDAKGEQVASGSGLVLTNARLQCDGQLMPALSNNVAEYIALLQGLRALPAGWCGYAYSDSQITLGRFFWGWANSGIPDGWEDFLKGNVLARLGTINCGLLDGHPTKKQLECGIGKRGNMCSAHNVWCDKECTRLNGEFNGYPQNRVERAEVRLNEEIVKSG